MSEKAYFGTLELKATDDGVAGRVRARFASLNQVDHDGDVTLPGAFGSQDVKLAAWGHGWGAGADMLPVGKGRISEENNAAIFDGSFLLETTPGRETYETVKFLGDLQEWSYGFNVLEASFGDFEGQEVRFLKKLKVHEVSPVIAGAGIETLTLDIKAAKRSIGPHNTATSEDAWDGPALVDHGDEVIGDVEEYIDRLKEAASLRAKDGSDLMEPNRERLTLLVSHVAEIKKALADLLTSSEPEDIDDVRSLFLEYQRSLSQ